MVEYKLYEQRGISYNLLFTSTNIDKINEKIEELIEHGVQPDNILIDSGVNPILSRVLGKYFDD